MKLTFIKEIEVKDPLVNVSVDLKTQKATLTINYTCPKCTGYGCRTNDNCSGGSVFLDLDPEKIDIILDDDTASKLRSIIQKLSSSMAKHQACDSTAFPVA